MTEHTRRTRAFYAGWISAGILLVVAAVAGVYAANLQIQLNDVELRLVDAVTRLQVSEERLVGAATESDAIRSNLALLSAPDVVELKLLGQGPASDATGRVFISRKGILFSASKLAPLQDGRAYQLWLRSRNAVVGAGAVHPAPDGTVTAAFDAPEGSPAVPSGFSVSIEPETGSPSPTGTVVLSTP
jgi:hypothetical protein